MSEPKFTPGPWEWSDQYLASTNEKTWSLIGWGGYGILSCDGEPNSPQCLGSSGEANAHLIAAAPELYEALEECAIDLKEWILGRYPEESLKYPSIKKDFELDISIVDKAFAALAKARGEG